MKTILLALFVSTSLYANREVNRLSELVNINSGTANIKGVLAVQQKIKPWFESLGFKVELRQNPEGEKVSAPLLVATMKGEKPEYLTFVMHADTVFEPTSPFQKAVMKDEFLMNAPGVMDDKGGIVVVLSALEQYLSVHKIPKYNLRVVVSPNEEVGSTGWAKTFQEFSKDSWHILGLEPGYDDYGLVHGRKGNIWYEIKVKGKEAHAGKDHKLGVNACQILARKMVEIEKLTDYKKNITTSMGRMEGGQNKYNIVCGEAMGKLDIRVPDLASFHKVKEKMARILKSPEITYSITDETPPFNMDKKTKAHIDTYKELIQKEEGRKVISHLSGGVGDVNQFSREGIIIIDGLGPVGGGAHTENEFLDLRTLESRSKILSKYLLSL